MVHGLSSVSLSRIVTPGISRRYCRLLEWGERERRRKWTLLVVRGRGFHRRTPPLPGHTRTALGTSFPRFLASMCPSASHVPGGKQRKEEQRSR